MARIPDLSLKNRLFMATCLYRRVDPAPWAEPGKRRDPARVALVPTGAICAPGQERFDEEGFQRDRSNLAFPLDRLREMAGRGEIGELNARLPSFRGPITAPGRHVSETAPGPAPLLSGFAPGTAG